MKGREINSRLLLPILLGVTVGTLMIVVTASVGYAEDTSNPLNASDSKILQQQNHSFIALLTGNNVIPPVSTNATGIVKFQANASNINELYYEINLTNIHNDVARVDVYLGNKTENGRSVVTLYQTTVSMPSEICCRSAASESERSKFFFNGTISTQNLEFGPLASSKNITDLVRLFSRGNTYVEVDTYQPESLSFSGSDSEIRGQIMPFASNSTTITADIVKPTNDAEALKGLPQNASQLTWEQFKDPENEFSMQYPSSWTLEPAENSFSNVDVEIVNGYDATSGLVQVLYYFTSEDISSMMKQYDVDQSQLEEKIDIWFPQFVTGLSHEFDMFNQTDGPQYEKYKIDGHKAGSIIFSAEMSGQPLAGWVTATLIGNKIFVFQYGADQNTFDTNLPMAEHMLYSIKILDG